MSKALPVAFLLFAAAVAVLPGVSQEPQKPAASPTPARLTTVVLDPAHGGADSGARGTGTIESEIVLDYARAIRVALEAKGFRPVLTRDGNQSPSFDDRSALINGLSDAMFVSLHVSSTGSIGTARVYFDSLPAASATAQASSSRNSGPSGAKAIPALLNWDRAQQPYLESSRKLAELVQIQLAQKFQGSPEVPSAAAIRQLRTVAAPAIAIEISSVASESSKLTQMAQPLGDAIARAAAAFQQGLADGSIESGPSR